MSPQPQVQPLPYKHRAWFFRFLVAIFIVTVPAFIFYAAGYRVNLSDINGSIMTVGGMFISAETANTQIFINDELVENYRIFQRAVYIASLPAGMHRLHVQGEGVQTWVKELPVYSHIVTEASAFNLPTIPQVRLITPYLASDGSAVVMIATSTMPASGTVTYRSLWTAATTTATTSLIASTEYEYLMGRFASSTAASSTTALEKISNEIGQFTFPAASPSSTSTASTSVMATTTKTIRDRMLYESEGTLYVAWKGSANNIPYYYCMPYLDATTTAALYGMHVERAMAAVYESLENPQLPGQRTCRDTIEINTENHTVYSFDFYPANSDLILVHHSDGLYVIETDDRAWQNAQQLYPAGEYAYLLDGSRIYVQYEGYIFEILQSL